MSCLEPMGNPSPRCRRQNPGDIRVSASLKSMLCEDLIWDVRDGSFALEVPYTAETKDLTDWLWDHGEVTAEYSRKGVVLKRRFRLPLPEYRRVLVACK